MNIPFFSKTLAKKMAITRKVADRRLDAQRVECLKEIIGNWLIEPQVTDMVFCAKQDIRSVTKMNRLLNECLDTASSGELLEISKSLDWNYPNLSLVAQLNLKSKMSNHCFKVAKMSAIYMDRVLMNSVDYKRYSALKDPKRSSCVFDSIAIATLEQIKEGATPC